MVVTAVIGCRYIDTAGTNGAIEWIKATGTGNTGWLVAIGDTGWRRVVSPGDIATMPNLVLLMRRVNQVVSLAIYENTAGGTASTLTTLYTLPTGWKCVSGPFLTSAVSNQSLVAIASVFSVVGGGADLVRISAVNGARHYSSLVYLTTNTWPSGSLPGVAV